MLIAMISVVIVIAVAMLFAILSSFIPFSNAYGNIVQYNSAYYAAMSAVERGCLATKYAGPGFDGESGWKYQNTNADGHYQTGNISDSFLPNFVSYGNAGRTTLYWNVKSKVDSIPMEGQGNVDPAFTNGNLYDYNALNYNSPILIPLGWAGNISKENYYKKTGDVVFMPDLNFGGIVGDFRVTPYLSGKIKNSSNGNASFAMLCTQNCPGSIDYTVESNAPVVDWVIKGKVDDGAEKDIEVSILPSEAVDVGVSYYVYEDRDTVIRKPHIGQSEGAASEGRKIKFADNRHPISKNNGNGSRDNRGVFDLNVMSRVSDKLKNNNNGYFLDIIKKLKNPYISFELVNNLWSEGSGSTTWAHHLYPFLEYKFRSLGGYFSDRYFTIKGEGKVGKYDVRLQVMKPTIKDSSFGNFTIIF